MKNSQRQAESKNAQELFCTCFFEKLYSKKIGFQNSKEETAQENKKARSVPRQKKSRAFLCSPVAK